MLTWANHPPLFARFYTNKGYSGFRHLQTLESEHKFTRTMTSSRELPMPNVTQISSLGQAHATLLHCWTKLSRTSQESPSSTSSTQSSPSSVTDEKRHFQKWLEQWELAFSAFLSNSMASMNTEDVTHSRILKTNHLACTILVSDAEPAALDVFEAEFRAIVELAGAVLRSRFQSDSPQDTNSSGGSVPFTAGLDVKEPLHVVVSRCNQASLRTRAAELLSRFCQ